MERLLVYRFYPDFNETEPDGMEILAIPTMIGIVFCFVGSFKAFEATRSWSRDSSRAPEAQLVPIGGNNVSIHRICRSSTTGCQFLLLLMACRAFRYLPVNHLQCLLQRLPLCFSSAS